MLVLAVVVALLLGAGILGAFGHALGAKGKHQRAADLAAMSAARTMAELYPRLFEAPVLPNGLPNPRHLPLVEYLRRARTTAVSAARANDVPIAPGAVTFPGASFAPIRVQVAVRGHAVIGVAGSGGGDGRRPGDDTRGGSDVGGSSALSRSRVPAGTEIPVTARATAEIGIAFEVPLGMPATGSGGGYDGPLAYRMGKPMRPDVAEAFDAMAAAARREAGLYLSVNSGFRSDAEQAELFAANPNPKWVAPPGTSLHRYGTELDLGPPAAYAWLEANCGRFGFIRRYA